MEKMENSTIKKACSFFISDMHFITMMLPYISKKVESDTPIFTILQKKQKENIELILNKINLNQNIKNEIKKINWEKTDLIELEIIKNNLNKILKNYKEVEILVSGEEKYINSVNELFKKIVWQNKIKIINCYEITDFNNNIQEILDKHDVIINTSGEHRKEEIYEGYKKKAV